MISFEIKYQVFWCQIHKKSIHYFPDTRIGQETMCWDCIREANLKGSKTK